MKLNWFSPLPPARTGISDYALELLPSLAERAEVVAWTEQDEVDPYVSEFVTVRRYSGADVEHPSPHSGFWKALNDADVNIYHQGNNGRHHASIWRLSQEVPGVVVVHDLSCQHLFREIHQHSPGRYLFAMEGLYGAEGREAAERHLAGRVSLESLAERYNMLGLALRGSLALLTHTPEAQEAVRWLVPAPAAYHPLCARAVPVPSERPPRSPGRRRVAVFGYLGPNRRVEYFLRALARFPRRDAYEVHVYGEYWDPAQLNALVGSLGLSSQVSVHGFVSDAVLDDGLAASDLAVNLRFPSMGEASLSQLRFWSHALPTLVTRTGWYATLPDSVVAHVRPEREQTDIMEHLGRFLEQPRAYETMGQRGREWLVRHHGPESYAETLLAAAEAAVQRRAELARGMLEELVAPGLADLPGAASVVREAIDALVGPMREVRLAQPADALAPRVQSVLGTLESAVARVRSGKPAQRSASTSSSSTSTRRGTHSSESLGSVVANT